MLWKKWQKLVKAMQRSITCILAQTVIWEKAKPSALHFAKETQHPPIVLCENKLPWVNEIMHLGSDIMNAKHMMVSDTMQKRAGYINRNNEHLQEFHFSDTTKIKINNCYNSRFYGRVPWDLFSKEGVWTNRKNLEYFNEKYIAPGLRRSPVFHWAVE